MTPPRRSFSGKRKPSSNRAGRDPVGASLSASHYDAPGADVRALIETLSKGVASEHASSANGRPEPAKVELDVTPLMENLRRQNEEFLHREMARMTEGLNAMLRQMQARLTAANAELSQIKTERDALVRIRSEYERKFDAIRDLARGPQG